MEVKKLQLRINILSIVTVMLLSCCIYLLFSENCEDVIRVKGIIVEDTNGKERILIGAPVPYAKNRVRTDKERVWKNWGNDQPEFMDWYEEYDNDNFGILILDSLGFDRIALGNHVPDLSFGQRIGPLTGLIINDEKGTERTGYGVLNINGENRVNLGLDDKNGMDKVSLSVGESGIYGLRVHDEKSNIFLGKMDSVNPYNRNQPFFNGLIIDDNKDSLDIVIQKNKQ